MKRILAFLSQMKHRGSAFVAGRQRVSMARDPFDDLEKELEQTGLGADVLGREMDPDGERGFLVADVPAAQADEAAALAETKEFEDITFEPSPRGSERELLRFGKRR